MGETFDISVPLRRGMPVWPGSPGIELTPIMRLQSGDAANVSRLNMDVHTGTHVDAPWHFLSEGTTVERLPLDVLIGPAVTAYLPDVDSIGPEDLAALDLPSGTERLLIRTRNSGLWAHDVGEFREDYVALTAAAAEWIVERRIRLVGVDYLSVQRFADDPETHRILLRAAVVLLEGLDLSRVEPGEYELICLPIHLEGADGAPARAVLRRN